MPKISVQAALSAALLAFGPLPALAQAAAPAPVRAPSPPLEYRSAFEDYRPFAPAEVQPWRQSNDTVRDIGGWKAYAREISGAKGPQAAPPKPAPGHGGHAK